MRKPTPLKRAIFESGLRQTQIAAELNIDKAHLSRIVNGLHANDATWAELARVLRRDESEIRHPDQAAA